MSEANTVVLVEGVSDRAAVETLARRLDRNLAAEGVAVVAMGGASAIATFLGDLAVSPPDVRVAGLCDEAEEDDFRRALERAGMGADLSRTDMEALGFYVCVADLEDELIRALGVSAVERVLHDQGELKSFRTMQNQPAWRGRAVDQQLRRFLGIKAGRKARYGRLLVEALDLASVPRPLARLLAHV